MKFDRRLFKEGFKMGYKRALNEVVSSNYDKIVSIYNSFRNNLYNLYIFIFKNVHNERDYMQDYFEVNFNNYPKAKKLYKAIELDFGRFSTLVTQADSSCTKYVNQMREELDDIYKKLQVPEKKVMWDSDSSSYDYAITMLWKKIKRTLGIKGKDSHQDYFQWLDKDGDRKEEHKEHLAYRREQAHERAAAEKERQRRLKILGGVEPVEEWQELRDGNRKAYNVLLKEIKEAIDKEGHDAQWEDGGYPDDDWSMRVYRRVTTKSYWEAIGKKYGLLPDSYNDLVYNFIDEKYGFEDDY